MPLVGRGRLRGQSVEMPRVRHTGDGRTPLSMDGTARPGMFGNLLTAGRANLEGRETMKRAINAIIEFCRYVMSYTDAELLQDYVDDFGEDEGLARYRAEGGAL